MKMRLGTLNLSPALERTDLLAKPVADALLQLDSKDVGVSEIDPAFSDTTAFCAHYQVGMERSANCVILQAKRADTRWFVACVILGSTRADINGLVRKTLDARRVSFAPMEEAVKQTNMEFGAITPIGLPTDWTILVDKAVTDTEYVIIGSGRRTSKLAVPGLLLARLPRAQVLEGLGHLVESSAR